MSALRLILVRHGQTQSNVDAILDTKLPGPPLTGEGRQQALRAGIELATEPVLAVYASPATRARETAAPIAYAHGLDVVVLPGTHEVQIGELEGRSDMPAVERYREVYGAWVEGDLDRAMPGGGETARQIRERYLAAIDRITGAHREGTVVLVSHAGVIRLMAGQLVEDLDDVAAGRLYLPNTGRVVLECDDTGWRCLAWPEEELV
ncbi:histidine phosphatase family protein [Allokutzneria sp. A3M-2-11 16]|uniref:histidine phosphatase family protein n=1 Tax=Allokutzneria sp. A3M-2-11 16 TaxID=2962043 RepID=UPI0020B888AB|nr:histidine phosphatase family protein [Allokutzneria sp. A3M-2-11 16]MCP3799640.1 histidine phosphatase family protein [Allokutzneria sp. A3M-2-11 16]